MRGSYSKCAIISFYYLFHLKTNIINLLHIPITMKLVCFDTTLVILIVFFYQRKLKLDTIF